MTYSPIGKGGGVVVWMDLAGDVGFMVRARFYLVWFIVSVRFGLVWWLWVVRRVRRVRRERTGRRIGVVRGMRFRIGVALVVGC